MRKIHLSTILITAALLAACAGGPPSPVEPPAPAEQAAPAVPPAPSEPPAPAEPPEPSEPQTPVEPVSPAGSETAGYEVIDEHTIKAGEITFDISLQVHTNMVRFDVHSRYPSAFEASAPGGNLPPLYQHVDIRFRDKDVALTAVGGGGGGGGEGDFSERGLGTMFKIEPHLEKGEKVLADVLVTFDEFYGIPEAVPFEFALPVADELKP